MHNKKETINIDTKLQLILKNGYPKIQNICKKLEENDNNMIILSSTERHELWYCIKKLLKNDQKSTKLGAKRNGNTDDNICADTYSSIVKVALQTLKFDYICDILPDIIILLNSRLPEINNPTVKDEISSFLEECWKLKLVTEQKIITNVLKHLTECAKVSLEHVIRLNNIKHAIQLLKSFEDIQNIMKLAREKTLLINSEGRDLLVHLFTIGEHWIMGIYNNIRVSLQTADSVFVKIYADILIRAWQSTIDNKQIIENCLENLIFHCLRAKRDINGRRKLGMNLLTFLESFHNQTNNDVKQMICDQYFQLIWKCLEAPGYCVRCNAADVFFLAYPMNVSNKILKTNSRLRKKTYLNKQHNAITNLLRDTNDKVCVIAIKGMFSILENFWTEIPSKLVDEWLNLALEHTKSSNSPEIRKNVFLGLKSLLSNSQRIAKLKEILPKFADSIYDTNVDVKLSVLEFFLQIESSTKIKIWDIVPLNCLIECLDATSHAEVVFLLHKLLWLRFSLSKDEESIVQEIIDAGQININVIRKFFLHSKNIISQKNALKIVNAMMSTITQETEMLPEKEINGEARVKRHKPSVNKENHLEKSNEILRKSGINTLSTILILVDVSALIYAVNKEDFLRNSFKDDVIELNLKIAEKLNHILEKFEDTQISETALFFFSLIPTQIIENHEEISEKFKRKLLDQNISDDTILSILHLLIKWNKADILLELLPTLLNVDENFQPKLASFVQYEITNNEDEIKRKTGMLKLGLRILEFIIKNEFQSHLVQKYHESMVQFWENLHFIKTLITNRFTNNNEDSFVVSDDILKIMFRHYVSLIPLLHHSDDFRSGSHFSRIVTWAQEEIVLHASDSRDIMTEDFSLSLLKCILDTSNDMIAQFKASPKLCCEIIIFYSKCLITRSGIAFVNNALVCVLVLLKFSTDMYKQDESELAKVVIPSLFATVMVTLNKYPVDLVKKYTNNLKTLVEMLKNLFQILCHPLNRDVLLLGYMAIVFNAAVLWISKDFEKLLSNEQCTSMNIINREFPLIAEEIIKIILHGEEFQELCIDILNKAISKFSSIDQLSSLLIIQRLVKSRNKTSIKKRKRIKNIISLVKEHNRQYSSDCNSFISEVKNKVINEILNS